MPRDYDSFDGDDDYSRSKSKEREKTSVVKEDPDDGVPAKKEERKPDITPPNFSKVKRDSPNYVPINLVASQAHGFTPSGAEEMYVQRTAPSNPSDRSLLSRFAGRLRGNRGQSKYTFSE